MNKIRWGIVGAGRIAETFATDIVKTTNAELAAVAARKESAANAFVKKFSVARAYGGYDKLFSDKTVDAIYIATPHTHHAEQARAAINAGKAVLCEKPICTSAQETRDLVSCANSQQVYLMEAMWTLFLPAIIKAREWISAGRIGELKQIKADFGYPLPYDPHRREYNKELAGGCLLEMGVYPLALTRLLAPESLPDKYQLKAHIAANGVEDDLIAILEYGDFVATIGTSFRCKLQNWAYLIGTEGYISIADFWRARSCSLYRLDECIDHFEEPRDIEGLNYQIESASQDILDGKLQSDRVPHQFSQDVQNMMDSLKRHFL